MLSLPMKTQKLAAYMKLRAEHEKQQWKLTTRFLEQHFKRGVRTFFGVHLGENGELLADEQQPAFFEGYKTALALKSMRN